MKYGKIENNNLTYAPNPIWTATKMIANPTEEQLLELGYKPIKETEMPQEDGFYFTPTYMDMETEIVQTWVRHEIEIEEILQ